MASSARIEELERKFNENPRRYFAPLANEYRKAGDLEQAIAICRTYVPQQPAHMSGHIVFGQALFEAGEHEEARGVFEAALALDPENLIALRHLGDIARERGEMSAARTWYQRVLDADPRNDEVATLLSAVNGPGGREPAADVPTWAEINPERTLELPPALLESATRETVVASGPSDVAATAPGQRNVANTFAPTLQPPPPAVASAGWAQGTAVVPEDIPGPGLVEIEPLETPAEQAAELRAPAPAEPVTPASIAAEMAGAGSGAALWGEPDATPRDAAHTAAPTDGLEPMEFVAPPHPPAPRASPPPAAVHDQAEEETPAVFVTETMAELYLQQGFRDEALSVYRQLLAQNPGDVTLRERVEQLEHMPQRHDADTFGAADDLGSQPALVQGIAGGQTIRAFFAALATRTWHGAENGATAAGPDVGSASADTPVAVMSSQEESLSSHAEPEAQASADEQPSAHQSSDEVEAVGASAATGSSQSEAARVDTAAPATGAEETDRQSPPISGDSDLQITHDVNMETVTAVGAASVRVMEDFGYTAATGVEGSAASEYDVASYDAADMSGAIPLPVRPPVSDEVPEEPTVEREAVAAANAAPAPPTPAPASESTGELTPAGVGDPNGAAPTSPTRKPMQTGSVNVLFPQETVRPTDETAAATLSNAFGGPTQPGVASVTGRPARPASNELSLDSIFREAPPPPADPRREPSAFSFDQFFTDATGSTTGSSPAAPSPGAAPRESTPNASGADTLSDAEQFSNWLAGLKKK